MAQTFEIISIRGGKKIGEPKLPLMDAWSQMGFIRIGS